MSWRADALTCVEPHLTRSSGRPGASSCGGRVQQCRLLKLRCSRTRVIATRAMPRPSPRPCWPQRIIGTPHYRDTVIADLGKISSTGDIGVSANYARSDDLKSDARGHPTIDDGNLIEFRSKSGGRSLRVKLRRPRDDQRGGEVDRFGEHPELQAQIRRVYPS